MAQRITINPRVLTGKPVIKGTRIPVYLILNLIEHGYTFQKIIETYPRLTAADIQAALRYAYALTKRETEFVIPRVAMR